MTKFTKSNGKYNVAGSKYDMLIGTRAQVWHGTAYKTSGGLKKKDLMQNKAGRIISKSKHQTAKKDKRLIKYGYGTQKGKFGYVKLSKSKKQKGGTPYGNSYHPTSFSLGEGIDGSGITKYTSNPSSIDVQLAAGQAGGKGYGWLNGNGIDGAGITKYTSNPSSIDVQLAAGQAGGKGYGWLNGNGIDGAGITKYTSNPSSIDVQLAAGQAGGKRRKKQKGGKYYNNKMMPGSPQVAALNAA